MMVAFPKWMSWVWIVLALASAVAGATDTVPPLLAAWATTAAATLTALTHSSAIPLLDERFGRVVGFISMLVSGFATVVASLPPEQALFSAKVAAVIGVASAILNRFARNIQGAITPAVIPPVVLLISMVLMSTVSCVLPKYDPVTIANLQAVKANDSACTDAIAHETSKAKPDPKTVRNLQDLCSCYHRAQNPTQRMACDSKEPAFEVYEKTKVGAL